MDGQNHALRIVFAGGGTGGHLYPALNLGRAIGERWQTRMVFFGTKKGLEAQKVPQAGYEIHWIPVKGMQRHLTLKNLWVPVALMISFWKVWRFLKKFKPHLVVGTGGYVMGPVLKTAQWLGIPTVVQEQNSYPGLTTRLVAQKAWRVYVAFRETAQFLPRRDNVKVVGNPVALGAVKESKEQIKRSFQLQEDRFTVLFFGGSQGSHSLNNALTTLIKERRLPDSIQILWQTGQREFAAMQKIAQQYAENRIRVLPYIDPMVRAYHIADLAICRSGAMTVSELIAMRVPAILIPFPHATGDHQMKNARMLADKNAAILIEDNNQLAGNLEQALNSVTQMPQLLQTMRENLAKIQTGNAIEAILEDLELLLRERYEIF